MWPSLETASRVSDVANMALVCSLVVGVVATVLIVWMANVKESYWEADRQQSRERVAGLESGVAEANARAAEANRIAEGERLARAKIEERLAPRSLTSQQAKRLRDAVSKFAGTALDIFVAGETQEIGGIAQVLAMTLEAAGWEARVWTWSGVGPVAGVVIFVRDGSDANTNSAADALTTALAEAGLVSGRLLWPGDWEHFGGMLNGPTWNPQRAPIRMVIGAKPEQ